MTDPVLGALLASGQAGAQALRVLEAVLRLRAGEDRRLSSALDRLATALSDLDGAMLSLVRLTTPRIVVPRGGP